MDTQAQRQAVATDSQTSGHPRSRQAGRAANLSDMAIRPMLRTEQDIFEAGWRACEERGDKLTPAKAAKLAAIIGPHLRRMQLLTIPETAALLRCSENHVYNLIADGELATVDIARPGSRKPKTRVPEDVAREFFAGRTTSAKRLRDG
jgi:hypothetical protein